jgi:hypothetical protein
MTIAPQQRRPTAARAIGGLLSIVPLLACAHDRPWCLERSHAARAQAVAVVQADSDRGSRDYYVFNFDDLPTAGLEQMSYKGTAAGHHLFKIYAKCTTSDALVYDVAIPERQCEVVHARAVKDETAIAHGTYRKPIRRDGKCTVEDSQR